jgi:hypothetical protein
MKLGPLLLALVASFPGVLTSAEKRQSFEDNSAEYVMPVGSRSSPYSLSDLNTL